MPSINQIINFFRVDLFLFLALFVLAIFGLMVLYSASSQNEAIVLKQIIHFFIGFGAMFFMAQIPPRIFKRVAMFLVVFGIITLALVYLVGTSRGGATRWLNLGFFMFQPSEMMKIITPIAIASIVSDGFIPPKFITIFLSLLIIIIIAVLILLQPDLGTAIIIASSGIFVLFFAGLSIRIFKNIYLNLFVIFGSIFGFLLIAWNFIIISFIRKSDSNFVCNI